MSIASRTSSRTSPHQSRAPPPADVFFSELDGGRRQVPRAERGPRTYVRDSRARARCRVHVCVVSNKNHASNSRPHARNTSNTKITSTRLVTRVTQSTRTRARRAAARTATANRATRAISSLSPVLLYTRVACNRRLDGQQRGWPVRVLASRVVVREDAANDDHRAQSARPRDLCSCW